MINLDKITEDCIECNKKTLHRLIETEKYDFYELYFYNCENCYNTITRTRNELYREWRLKNDN